jgi:hypothetical protein
MMEGIQIEVVKRKVSAMEMWVKGLVFHVVKAFVRLANA